MKEELQEKLARAARYFQIAEEFENRVDVQEDNILKTQNQFRDEKIQAIQKWDIIRFIFSAVLIFSLLVFLVALERFQFQLGVDSKEGITYLLCVMGVSIPCAVIIISSKKISQRRKKFDALYKNEVEPQIREFEHEIQSLKEMTMTFVKENNSVIDFLPMQYRNIQAVSFMLVAVTSGRADSLKEVYNLYEEQLHRWKLEDAAMESIQVQEYMIQAVHETNDHLKQIEFMQYLQYFQNSQNQN